MGKSKEKVLEDYIKFKSVSVTTEEKRQEYGKMIMNFINSNDKPLKSFKESDLVNFLNSMNGRYNIGSMNALKSLLKNFIIWYFPDYSQRFRNMNILLKHLKEVPRFSSKDMLSKDEVEKLIKGEDSTYWKTFWLVQFYGGMRPSETAKLKWNDITFSDDGVYIEVLVKKNQKRFTKFLPSEVSFYLNKLKSYSASELVFPSRVKREGKDSPMERNAIHRRLKILSMKVLGKRVVPYQLRHSIATILYNQDGVDKNFVAEQMGHSKNMEKVYSHLSEDKIKEKLKKLYIKTEDMPVDKKIKVEQGLAIISKVLSLLIKQNKDMKINVPVELFQELENMK